MNKPKKNSAGIGKGWLPYPETDLSPTLQRTIKRKIEHGEADEADREALKRLLRRAAESDSEE